VLWPRPSAPESTPWGRPPLAAEGAYIPIDSNGNLATRVEGSDSWAYEWNAENQLTRITKNSVEQARFAYDPLGRRVEKVAGGVTTSYTYEGDAILREIQGATTLKYVHGPRIDEPLQADDGVAVEYLHADGLGSIVKVTNVNGLATLTRQYDSWGTLQVGANEPGYAFTGREWDSETGLYYYRARYFDSVSGLFLSEDPLKFAEGGNFYAYVAGKPTTLTDPMGLCSCPENKRCPSGNWLLNGDVTLGGGVIGWFQWSWGTLQCQDRQAVQRPAKIFCGGLGPILGGGLMFDQQYNPPWAQTGVDCADDLKPLSFKQWMGTFFVVSASGASGSGNITNVAGGPSAGAGFAWLNCKVTPK